MKRLDFDEIKMKEICDFLIYWSDFIFFLCFLRFIMMIIKLINDVVCYCNIDNCVY